MREASGLSPVNDGGNIIINVPPMSEELRKELVKVIVQTEDGAKKQFANFATKPGLIYKTKPEKD